MPAFLRPILARLIAAWVAALSGWLSATVGIDLAPDEQVAVINAGLGLALTVYALVHRAIDARINPRDAAAPSVAAADEALRP